MSHTHTRRRFDPEFRAGAVRGEVHSAVLFKMFRVFRVFCS